MRLGRVLETTDKGARVAAAAGIARSPQWDDVVKLHLLRQPHCVCCKAGTGSLGPVQVHHIFPFHYCVALGRPDLELDERNLITLCGESTDRRAENHHLWIGHLDNFRSSNLSVVRDARVTFHGVQVESIIEDERWLRRRAKRMKPLELMSRQDKAALRELMDRRMPR